MRWYSERRNNMGIWAMTGVIVYKSLWWIIPGVGYIIAIAITDKEA